MSGEENLQPCGYRRYLLAFALGKLSYVERILGEPDQHLEPEWIRQRAKNIRRRIQLAPTGAYVHFATPNYYSDNLWNVKLLSSTAKTG
ncbi:MAG: hypothetical protein WDN46_04065 [Methylocella sp.]